MSGKLWTKAELDYLKKNYPHKKTKEIQEYLGRSLDSVRLKAHLLQIKKTKAFKRKEAKRLANTGAKYRFPKGHVPVNKGKKLHEFMSPEGIAASSKTRFQKGNQPHNTKGRNGVVVNRVDKTGRIYKYIRLSEANWVPLHRHIWEKANGPIPEGDIIIFLDNNTENYDLDNLKCVSKAENMLRNSRHNYPEEIIPSMLLINQLETILKQKDNG